MASAIGTCRWCRASAKLVDAHIVPSAFYDQLVESGGIPLLLGSEPGFRPKRRPSGTYDSGILCSTCEARFSSWDDYGVEVFRDRAAIEPSRFVGDGQGGKFLQLESAADGRLLCFVTSLLWRASVSIKHEFRRVDLGPHEEIIRTSLDPVQIEALSLYSFVVTRFTDEVGNKVMTGPYTFKAPSKHGGRLNAYAVSLPGWSLLVKVDKRDWPEPIHHFAHRVGRPTLAIMTESTRYKSLWDGIVEIMKNSA